LGPLIMPLSTLLEYHISLGSSRKGKTGPSRLLFACGIPHHLLCDPSPPSATVSAASCSRSTLLPLRDHSETNTRPKVYGFYFQHPTASAVRHICSMLLQLLKQISRFTRLDNGGEPTMGDTLSMPEGTSTGTLWDPPSGEACCGGVY
jgi:hypothetical protein